MSGHTPKAADAAELLYTATETKPLQKLEGCNKPMENRRTIATAFATREPRCFLGRGSQLRLCWTPPDDLHK